MTEDRPVPGPQDPDDVDRRFSEIVAGLRAPDDDAINPPLRLPPGEAPREVSPGPGPEGPGRWRESAPADDSLDHFVPEPPPPLPAGDLHFWAVLLGLTLGPLLLVLANVVPVLQGEVWTWLGIGLSVTGFVLLVLRPPTPRDGDWGAQV